MQFARAKLEEEEGRRKKKEEDLDESLIVYFTGHVHCVHVPS